MATRHDFHDRHTARAFIEAHDRYDHFTVLQRPTGEGFEIWMCCPNWRPGLNYDAACAIAHPGRFTPLIGFWPTLALTRPLSRAWASTGIWAVR